jgi:ABC-type nitrate/sulfonate/bicarbonate transport system substrate-binding protein
MKLVVPDLISNSYFPVIAAADLGFFAREGVDIEVELLFPVSEAYNALHAGAVEFVGGSAHSALAAFPGFEGAKLLAAQAQGMYWSLVMRADLGAKRGQIECVKRRTIGAAPWVDLGLRALLTASGIDVERDRVNIIPVPGSQGASINFGVTVAKALADRRIDGFWANGMGAEVAVRGGAGTVVLDVRRGDGPRGCFNYTFSALATSDAFIARHRDVVHSVVRALVATQAALRADPECARAVGEKRFPSDEAELITTLIRRDLPFYTANITNEAVRGMTSFANGMGILDRQLGYEDVVALEMAHLWGVPGAAT